MTVEVIATACAAVAAEGHTPSGNKVLAWLKARGHRVNKKTVLKLMKHVPPVPSATAPAPTPAPVPVVAADHLQPWERPYIAPEVPNGSPYPPEVPRRLERWEQPFTGIDPENPDYRVVVAQANGHHGDPAERLQRADAALTRIEGQFRDACDHLVHVKGILLATRDLPIGGILRGSLHADDERHQEALDDVLGAKQRYDALWQERAAARQALKDARTAYRLWQQEQWVRTHTSLVTERDQWRQRVDEAPDERTRYVNKVELDK